MAHRILPFLGSTLLLAACSAPSASITPRYMQFDIDGDIGVQQGSSVSAQASVDSLGLEKDDSVIGVRVDLELGGHWTLSAQDSKHDGDGTADATLSQGGITINTGDPVSSKLDLGLYSAAVTWDLLPTDAVELGLGLGVTAFDLDAKITEKLGGQSVSTNELLPVPFLAGRVGFELGPVDVSGLLGWVSINYSGDEASFLDFDGMARMRIFGDGDRLAGWIALGYRYLDAEVAYEDGSDSVDADIQFSGPWLGLVLSF
ncbi:MAG: hypothetical protein K8S98_09885 [Planctomycetes bacterium]|nr:hypothetical protein [Planctomycetota bacterium]